MDPIIPSQPARSYAAAHQPFVLIPGANHAQTSNGVINTSRGDIEATLDYAAATEQLAAAVAAFVTSHQAVQKGDRQAAGDGLLVMVRRTAEMVAPYFMASGGGVLNDSVATVSKWCCNVVVGCGRRRYVVWFVVLEILHLCKHCTSQHCKQEPVPGQSWA